MPSRSAPGAGSSRSKATVAQGRRPSARPALSERTPILWEPQRQWGASISVRRADGSELVRVVACTPNADSSRWTAVGLETVRPEGSDLGEMMQITLDARRHEFLGEFDSFSECRPTAEAFLYEICSSEASAA